MERYESIYERMKDRYETLCGESVDESGDVAIRLRVLAGELYNMQTALEWHKRQMFADTASGEYLDHLAAQRGRYAVLPRRLGHPQGQRVTLR